MSSEKFLSPLTTITYIRTYILIDRDRERERERERRELALKCLLICCVVGSFDPDLPLNIIFY